MSSTPGSNPNPLLGICSTVHYEDTRGVQFPHQKSAACQDWKPIERQDTAPPVTSSASNTVTIPAPVPAPTTYTYMGFQFATQQDYEQAVQCVQQANQDAKAKAAQAQSDAVAQALNRIAVIAETWFQRIYYPEARVAAAARVTVLESAADKELAETIQGFGGQFPKGTIDQWRDPYWIGPRERDFLRREAELIERERAVLARERSQTGS